MFLQVNNQKTTLKCDTENLGVTVSLGMGYKDTGNLRKNLVSVQSGVLLGLRMACPSEWGAYPLPGTLPFFCTVLF